LSQYITATIPKIIRAVPENRFKVRCSRRKMAAITLARTGFAKNTIDPLLAPVIASPLK
jgi:hypothetical protein